MDSLVDSAAYSSRVVQLFDRTPRVGAPPNANHRGRALSAARGTEVTLHLRVASGIVEAAGFNALGCPHAIAAAALVCADLEGRPLDALAAYDARFLETALPLPGDKLDIRLLLEDAARDAARGE